MPESPTGQQFLLRSGEHSAVVVELGAGLRDYTVGGRRVLDGYTADEPITGVVGSSSYPGRTASAADGTTGRARSSSSR